MFSINLLMSDRNFPSLYEIFLRRSLLFTIILFKSIVALDVMTVLNFSISFPYNSLGICFISSSNNKLLHLRISLHNFLLVLFVLVFSFVGNAFFIKLLISFWLIAIPYIC